MKPIILRAHEVRQLQETGEVLVVRLIKPQPVARTPNDFCFLAGDYAWRAKGWRSGTVSVSNKPGGPDGFAQENCPLGTPTERRWVRETWGESWHHAQPPYFYRAVDDGVDWHPDFDGWRSPVTMPRQASRYVVEIAEVQARQVQAITEAEAIAAGVQLGGPIGHIPSYRAGPYAYHFAQLWDCMNGPGSWSANPWIWLARARRVEQ